MAGLAGSQCRWLRGLGWAGWTMLVAWPAGWLAGWLTGWLGCWLAEWHEWAEPTAWLIDWVGGWLAGWQWLDELLDGCLSGRLTLLMS